MEGFPQPFAGIQYMIPCTREELIRYVNQLMFEENHRHNFAISVDGCAIWVSESAARCLGVEV